ncbi:MAG: DUF308 domain-containing protein [Christensenellaceae bacterium]
MSEETKNTEEQPKSRMNMNDAARKVSGGTKVGGIIVAIIMIVLGILFFVKPVVTMIAVEWIAAIGIMLYGLWQVIAYIKTPSDMKNGWSLANGIIFIILGILILTMGIGGRAEMFAFLLGFMAMFSGINQIASYAAFKKSGEPGAGWILASGIINLILGIFFILTPFVATWAMQWIFAIYLIIGGIALFAEACSGKTARKA